MWTWERLQVFKMLLASFFPLALLILAVLGSIVFGFATPTEAAAVGAFGGFLLAAVYRFIEHWRLIPRGQAKARAIVSSMKELGAILKDSSFLTAKTTAMVCWLFVGSAIFSAAFALLGGQDLVEKWVLSLDLTPLQFMILAQFIIFILGWPLEWTEIIVIFMPIFIPLLPHFNIDPLFFGLLVALNLQTAFPLAAGCHGRVLPERRGAAARDAESDIRGHDAFHGDPGGRARAAVHVSRVSGCGCRRRCISETVAPQGAWGVSCARVGRSTARRIRGGFAPVAKRRSDRRCFRKG